MEKIYDVVILGAGPAGLAAGIYAGRARLSVLIVEKAQDGGQIAITAEIENYPGQIVEGESGPSLIARMTEQCKKFDVERVSDLISEVDIEGEVKVLKGAKGEYKGKNLIIATGAHSRPIACEREAEFVGRGISYCATCDANFFEDLEVYVVGGGDSAVEEAMYLTKFARKVTLIHRRNKLRAAKSIQEKAFKNPKLEFMWDSVVTEVHGDDILSGMTVKNVKTGELTQIQAALDQVGYTRYTHAGYDFKKAIELCRELAPEGGNVLLSPACASFDMFDDYEARGRIFKGIVNMDERGYIITDEEMHTNIPNVYAAGDVRVKRLRQVVTAAADGAIAAVMIEKSLSDYE